MTKEQKYFLPYQVAWICDQAGLKIVEKSRQIGFSYCTAYSAVRRVAAKGARLDVWVSSRDDTQAKLFLDDCKNWAKILQLAATDLGEVVFDKENEFTAYVLKFASGLCIYSLSSNPNALAGKRGHVILDEFALHKDQRLLYRIAKPVTTWGGQLEIISTHRGSGTVFNEIIRDIKEKGNKMGWSHHRVTIHDAVEGGLVEKINEKTGRTETREDYLARIQAECLDEEQWAQEYNCVPSDDSTAFISYEMIAACRDAHTIKDFDYLSRCTNPLYLGADFGRKKDLTVFDVGEKIGDVVWDRMRIELKNKSFSEQEFELHRLLALPQMKRGCLDGTGLGMQMAERAIERFGYKVESITFTGPVKEELAFPLRAAFEDKKLRIADDNALTADLRGIKKETTAAGNIRFIGESEDSHCDRFWAMALRQHAAGMRVDLGAAVG
jgi:phage FluMu gp28-like protein